MTDRYLFVDFADEDASGADISECGNYRTLLWRHGDFTGKDILWVMLNPSTADGREDDPTIRRVVNFSKAWGYGMVWVVNLFDLRSTDPAAIRMHPNPVSPDNDEAIAAMHEECDLTVCAWGNHGAYLGRSTKVLEGLRRVKPVHYLRLNRSGEPQHPLYLPGDLKPVLWEEGGVA